MSKQAKEILIQEKADEEKNKEVILILLDVVGKLHSEGKVTTKMEISPRLSTSYLDTVQFLSHGLTISV